MELIVVGKGRVVNVFLAFVCWLGLVISVHELLVLINGLGVSSFLSLSVSRLVHRIHFIHFDILPDLTFKCSSSLLSKSVPNGKFLRDIPWVITSQHSDRLAVSWTHIYRNSQQFVNRISNKLFTDLFFFCNFSILNRSLIILILSLGVVCISCA